MTLADILQLLGSVGVGLIAGILFAFSVFIMRALAQVPPAEGIRVMQTINRTIITPLFLIVFMGTAVVSLAEAVRLFMQFDDRSLLSLGAVLCYLLGTFAITVVANIPMNERLAALDADDPASQDYWAVYLRVWTRWNHVRTVAPTLALVLWHIA